ncbi:FkbM family methyltransferase [Aestuariivita sp.]|uniref:FkbM family methyltransferase n=1 Tax=Aestuariivita sp. TaxID=1872407 RepID=UPI002171E900|nr:FkbM family methyltransferase [Aestuariivita sp.]MCE8008023.1 FkbM family methyltransferase [Aestuariivita sp.]
MADAAMDAKMRQIWSLFEKPWAKRLLRAYLPPTQVRSMGCDFIVHPRDNFTEFTMWETGLPPEHEATAHIADRLRGTAPVIVDVGANAGAFFLPLHVAGGPGTRSVVFEPNPVMRARLERNIALNTGQGVTVFECAVSDEEGRSALYFPRNGNLGQGRVTKAYPHKKGAEGAEVALRPLRDCLAEAGVGRIDFLKVDVEGLEDRVLMPVLTGDAALHPGLLYFETVHDRVWSLPLMKTLGEAGYALVQEFDGNSLFERGV